MGIYLNTARTISLWRAVILCKITLGISPIYIKVNEFHLRKTLTELGCKVGLSFTHLH